MCGIVGYLGERQALPLLLEGLKRLEYRGYDSAGVAIRHGDQFHVCREIGKVAALEAKVGKDPSRYGGTEGMAHTRWATHGMPSERNAHPHRDDKSGIVLVHNGIIENYQTIKKALEAKGHRFTSETDTEVLAMLVGELYEGDLESAVQAALREVTGAYAIVVACEGEPGVLVAARKGSPLMVGVGRDEYVVASDPSAIVAHTQQAFALEDFTVCRISREGYRTSNLHNAPVTPKLMELEMNLEQIELGDFPHFMLKEIFEQPDALRNTLGGRIDLDRGEVVLGGLQHIGRDLAHARHIVFTGQGTAWHAALIAEYMMEALARIPCEVQYASEFRYRNPIVEDGTVLVAISQSGETADTLAALEEAKARGATTLGIVNVVGSSIARMTDAGVYLRVGPEIGVASTKAFTGQLAVSALIALYAGRRKHLSIDATKRLLGELNMVPDKIRRVLDQSDAIRDLVAKLVDRENWLFLGRGYNYPVALEGALKIKEISYIHAEGMPAAEMKHGPIALIHDGMPCVFVAPRGSQHEKVIGNMQEVRARGGRIIAIATDGDEEIAANADEIVRVPHCPEVFSPMVTTVALQLMAYHAAVLRGHDVDKPRNLAKSVTVE
ncbi:MAG TPA: glutamine--fructose-6-phosphate transaminase (isomerizing) [Fibrobacteria bacterium]|nr:glutamine--fructose-6-phosphate transaminase (isomerizing) [Fibrobacteria bacterium]